MDETKFTQQIKNIQIDGDHSFPATSPLCSHCKNYTPENGLHSCRAFEKIPLTIWTAEDPHLSPHEGDSGIQFEIAPHYLSKG